MPLRDSPPFGDYGYWPNTPSQWTQATVDDCTWYATEFAYESADPLHTSVHPVRDLRKHSTDTVGGTPVEVALRDTDRLWPTRPPTYVYGLMGWQDIKAALRSGLVLVLGGDYEKLPEHYRRWTNNDTFDHALAIKFLREDGTFNSVALYDPLGGGPQFDPYDGEWIRFDALFGNNAYTWKSGTKYWVGVVYSERSADRVSVFYNPAWPSNRKVRLKSGAQTYNKPVALPRFEARSFWNVETKRWAVAKGGGWYIILHRRNPEDPFDPFDQYYVRKEDILAVNNVGWGNTGEDCDALREQNRGMEADLKMIQDISEKHI